MVHAQPFSITVTTTVPHRRPAGGRSNLCHLVTPACPQWTRQSNHTNPLCPAKGKEQFFSVYTGIVFFAS